MSGRVREDFVEEVIVDLGPKDSEVEWKQYIKGKERRMAFMQMIIINKLED